MQRVKKTNSRVVERFLNTSWEDVRERIEKGLAPLDVEAICQGSNKKMTLDERSLMMKHFIKLLHAYGAYRGLDSESALNSVR